MRYSFIVSALFAATAIAAPAVKVVDVVEVITETVTAGTAAATPPPKAPAAPAQGEGFLEQPKSSPAPAPAAHYPSPSPSPQASSGGDDGSPMSGGASILSTANKWRKLYNIPELTWSASLEVNSFNTGNNGGGVNEVHMLIPNTNMGQVITPGQQAPTQSLEGDTCFELAYVSWLCEVPTDPQLSSSGNGIDQCALVKQVLNMEYTDTGHHDILVNPDYSTIGCAFAANPQATDQSTYQGLWVCGLGTS